MAEKEHMNLIFIGHVDHGKSTTVGRVLYDTGAMSDQELKKLKEEADKVIAQALAAGALLLKAAADTFWGGYSGYFADPDGHPWEVAWNPFFPLE